MKATGKEITQAYLEAPEECEIDDINDEYLEGAVHEDTGMNLVDTEMYDLAGIGFVQYHDGKGSEESFEEYFKKWKKRQTVATFIVEVNKDQEAEARKSIKGLGYKIL